MSLFDKLAREVEDEAARSNRRTFLGKVSKFWVAAAAVVTGLARTGAAEARTVACCNLGSETNCPCRGCCSCSGGKSWSWGCVDNLGRVWECGECYQGSNCNSSPYCCSWAHVGGLAPAG